LVRHDPGFAYHFISQGYKSSGSSFDPTREEALLLSLCEQLDEESTTAGDPFALRMRFQGLLGRAVDPPAVVVLDAVDEIDRHPSYLRGLFPPALPPGRIVILSARKQGDRYYLSEIGLAQADIGLHLELSGLDEEAIKQLLVLGGGVGKRLAARGTFVTKLHEVSRGDPFYLRFLVEDVARGQLTPRNIDMMPSGLPEYFDRQLSQLNRSAFRSQHRDILLLILRAKGPLSRASLIRMVPGLDGLNFDDILRDIHRFLLVHDDRYTFCHPRFKDYFVTRI